MKEGFIYVWYDRKRKMFYVGCHWGTEDDGYICSSNRMRDAYRRRPQDFKRRIVQRNIERISLLEEEHRWLQMIPEVDLGRKYYNLRQHKWGHWSTDETTKKTTVEKRKETLKTSESWKIHVESQKGKIVSEVTKEKIRQKAIEQFSNPENRRKAGLANIGISRRIGFKHSIESKQKMSETRKGRIPWNKGLKFT